MIITCSEPLYLFPCPLVFYSGIKKHSLCSKNHWTLVLLSLVFSISVYTCICVYIHTSGRTKYLHDDIEGLMSSPSSGTSYFASLGYIR